MVKYTHKLKGIDRMENKVDKNYKYFKENLTDLLANYNGEFLVIQDEKVVFHNADMNQIVIYVEKLDAGSYIIQKCKPEETQQYHTFHNWVRYESIRI